MFSSWALDPTTYIYIISVSLYLVTVPFQASTSNREMAEPVGITGTAVGIVSFGLKLYTGISEYLDAIKGVTKTFNMQGSRQRHCEIVCNPSIRLSIGSAATMK
ncbi:ankyrin repeat-containing protein [Fusarium circinatum]|uniref:Ankyrin repeat-containing protein n=1 Tax=Fusarium circinatum TaxID=48490 RepID=A0A8H5WKY8_FUSCI|nr:ankyrin repeat-containing protein [Fusarium circinatum]